MEDAETGEQMYVDTHDPKFRAQYTEAIQRRAADLTATFRRAGVETWSFSTSEDLVRAILRYAMARKRIYRTRGNRNTEPAQGSIRS
jgi:uncharacterized protein (DUF58 family)